MRLFWAAVCVWLGCVVLHAMPVDTVYNRSYDWVSGQRDSLPEWVFSPQGQGMVIAVSDPCME